MAPESVQAVIGHLQEPADIRRLAFVEEEVCAWRVRVDAIATFEKAQCDESVQKIPVRPRMKAKPVPDGFSVLGVSRELGEELHLDCAKKHL